MNTIFLILLVAMSHLHTGASTYFKPLDLNVVQEPTQQQLCVKYETEDGWSKGYSVNVTIIKGSELNRRTKTYNYSSYSTYAVIFWGDDQASVIKLSYYTGSIGVYGVSGTDAQGREWKLAKNRYCL